MSQKGLKTMPCANFSMDDLHKTQHALFQARAPALDSVYQAVDDRRRMIHSTLDVLRSEQEMVAALPHELLEKARDGACHEMVMWYVHHLSADARDEIRERIVLPLLPEVQHPVPASTAHKHEVHRRYQEQVSCAICHVTSN